MRAFSTIEGRKIRVGVVGCGRISKNHFDSIEHHGDNLELASLCDVDESILQRYQDQYKVNAYLSLEQMLENEELDLVCICTQSGMHSEQVVLCAQYDVHVMTEKLIRIDSSRQDAANALIFSVETSGIYNDFCMFGCATSFFF